MRKWFVAFTLLCVAGVLVLILNRSKPHVRTSSDVRPSKTNQPASAIGPVNVSNRTSPPEINASAPASNAIAAATVNRATVPTAAGEVKVATTSLPEFTNFPAAIVLENMRLVFRQYSSTFGGNPVGTNPEITRMLNGGNPKETKFIKDEDGLRINGNGELVDSWGTPFFFHQLSGTQMEIHSAGPDRVMWTADDLVVK